MSLKKPGEEYKCVDEAAWPWACDHTNMQFVEQRNSTHTFFIEKSWLFNIEAEPRELLSSKAGSKMPCCKERLETFVAEYQAAVESGRCEDCDGGVWINDQTCTGLPHSNPECTGGKMNGACRPVWVHDEATGVWEQQGDCQAPRPGRPQAPMCGST